MSLSKGIYTALLTPFTGDDKINEKELEKLVSMNIEKGVDGFYVGGSTAEAFLLSIEERKQILEVAASSASGRANIIAHVGCVSTKQTIELAKHAETIPGISAISAVTPFYYKFSFDELKKHYFSIVENVSLPMLIYYFPAGSGTALSISHLSEFLNDKRFAGIKYTSNDFYTLERIKNHFPNKLAFNGFDEMFLAGLSMGADGGIGSTYNFMSEKFIQIKQLFEQGKNNDARDVQREVNTIIEVLIQVGVLAGEKEILAMMGFNFGTVRSPFKPLSVEETELLRKAVKSARMI